MIRGSRPPFWPLLYLFAFRFAVMPVISGAAVFGMRRLLDGKILSDPMLVSCTIGMTPIVVNPG